MDTKGTLLGRVSRHERISGMEVDEEERAKEPEDWTNCEKETRYELPAQDAMNRGRHTEAPSVETLRNREWLEIRF